MLALVYFRVVVLILLPKGSNPHLNRIRTPSDINGVNCKGEQYTRLFQGNFPFPFAKAQQDFAVTILRDKVSPVSNPHFKCSKTQHTLMNADVKWFCMSTLLRDWIWILIYSNEGVLVIATCSYTRDRNLKNVLLSGFHQQNDTRYQCSYIWSQKFINSFFQTVILVHK